MGLTVTHVIQSLSRGGPTRSLVAAAGASAGEDIRHRVVALEPGVGGGTELAAKGGLPVIESPDRATLLAELEHADIVHVHFWNTPELYAVLAGPLPPMRLLVACKVGGAHAPQVLTSELLAFADLTIATSTYSASLPVLARAGQSIEVIPSVGGWERVHGVQARPHRQFNIGYLGTVDFAKMHPQFVSMSARAQVASARFVVCGTGDAFRVLARQAQALGVRDRFDLRGYVEDIGSVFAQLDIFGYPLCEQNYSASEIVLQEAMYCGVPPVVLAHGGAAHAVIHGRTGLIAENESAYVRAIERLHSDAGERRRLGAAAADHARAAWNLEKVGARWADVYVRLAGRRKRARSWPRPPASVGANLAPAAARFVQSLGGAAPEFTISLGEPDDERVLQAEEEIIRAPAVLASADGGGVLHWRRRHPEDPWLHLWAGLVLHGQGRLALAAGEFKAALRLGLDRSRVRRYLARSANTGAAMT